MYINPEVFKFTIQCNRKLQGNCHLKFSTLWRYLIIESFTYISYMSNISGK